MKFKILPLMLLWIFSNSIGAKVLLPEILSDNMVLQQNTKVNLWGNPIPEKQLKFVLHGLPKLLKLRLTQKETGRYPLLHLQQVLLIPSRFPTAKK